MIATLVHTIQEKWKEKKQAPVLFMDVKGAFDNVLKEQLFNQIIELKINDELVAVIL